MVLLRRLVLIMVLLGASSAGYAWWQRRSGPDDSGPPEWPPLDPDAATPTGSTDGPAPTAPDEAATAPAPPTEAVSEPAAESVSEPAAEPTAESDAGLDGATTWVAPVDGACPPGHPVKVNETSGIFHVPGGRFYDRTIPDRCYVSAEAAAADGYRASKA